MIESHSDYYECSDCSDLSVFHGVRADEASCNNCGSWNLVRLTRNQAELGFKENEPVKDLGAVQS